VYKHIISICFLASMAMCAVLYKLWLWLCKRLAWGIRNAYYRGIIVHPLTDDVSESASKQEVRGRLHRCYGMHGNNIQYVRKVDMHAANMKAVRVMHMYVRTHMHCRSCHPVITTMSTALPTCHLRCMSNKLIFLICILPICITYMHVTYSYVTYSCTYI
jgi:hypothetical protein